MNTDANAMTPEEHKAYALGRVQAMSHGLECAKDWYRMCRTPLNKLVLEMAKHQLQAAERRYRISRGGYNG